MKTTLRKIWSSLVEMFLCDPRLVCDNCFCSADGIDHNYGMECGTPGCKCKMVTGYMENPPPQKRRVSYESMTVALVLVTFTTFSILAVWHKYH